MKEKVELVRPNGEIEERDVVCYFKSITDAYPNIKNIAVLVVDKKEQNNGNNVLEFFWEKDGLYHSISDDAAWGNVKSVIVDIIKSNFEGKIEVLKASKVNTSMENGRSLALNLDQLTKLVNHYNEVLKINEENKASTNVDLGINENKVATFNASETTVMNENPVMTMENPANSVVAAEQPVISIAPEISDNSVIDPTNNASISLDVNEEIAPPIVTEAKLSNVSDIFEASPVIESSSVSEISNVDENVSIFPNEGQVQFVKNQKEVSDFDKIILEIQHINEEYDEKIKELNHERQSKIQAILQNKMDSFIKTENEIRDLKVRAEEHLKNAQAAEQIATIAQQNAQNVQNQIPVVPEITEND